MRKLDRFQGCLVAAAIGDCLGAPFEGRHRSSKIGREKITKRIGVKVMASKNEDSMKFTDDTAMSLSVCRSLVHSKGFDAVDMANRFAKEFKREPNRGYGSNIVDVFNYWIDNGINKKNVYYPALKQFDGSGSYGNGAAMRVAAVALYAKSATQCLQLAKKTAMLTHTNKNGYLGAMLLALAVYHAIQADQINTTNFIAEMKKELSILKLDLMDNFQDDDDETERKMTLKDKLHTYTVSSRFSYVDQLDVIQELLNLHNKNAEEDDVELVQLRLGNNVSAQQAVPAALYAFLRNIDKSIEETLYYSISLGGDTDTIACMCLALAGAYNGFSSIPSEWVKVCESTSEQKELAENLFSLH